MQHTNTTTGTPEQPKASEELPGLRRVGHAVLGAGLLLVVAAGLLAASGTAGAVLAFPIPNATAVLPDATATPSGHNVAVEGTVACTEGEIVAVEVVVTQPSTGAEATGTTHARCEGVETIQGWTIHAATDGPTAFEAGDAHVEAWAETRARGARTDTLQWDRDVTIHRR